jgi:hypothetical protein
MHANLEQHKRLRQCPVSGCSKLRLSVEMRDVAFKMPAQKDDGEPPTTEA